jgi:[protein-PII] uridylyltransferase
MGRRLANDLRTNGKDTSPSLPAFRNPPNVRGRSWNDVKDEVCLWAKEHLAQNRSRIRERHRSGATGAEVAAALTEATDNLLGALHRLVGESSDAPAPRSCALVALGGYGRKDLAPGSDVDLLFLHSGAMTTDLRLFVERFLHTLWDIKLDVGHATRTRSECVRFARKDPRVKSSLIDARLLCGDETLYRDFEKTLETNILQKGKARFIKEKLEERRARHSRSGGSVYVLEPMIKDGVGGLRDIHTVLWIAKARYRISDWADLRQRGIVTAKELSLLFAARDFLLRARNELHFQFGKHQDQLSFDIQEEIAKALGFRDTPRGRGVEAFMKVYYLHTAAVEQLTTQWIQRMLKPQVFHHGALQKGREIREGVRIHRRTLNVTAAARLHKDPTNLISLFADAQEHGAEIGAQTRDLIRQNLHKINDALRRSTAANQHFFRILRGRERVYETLLAMHRLRVLDRFIPEFGQLLCLVQHDLYHIYTVDEHSLMGIREMEELKEGRFKDESLLLTQVIRDVEKIEVLYLGMMFHDIGKGHGKSHSEIGAEMVQRIARRMHMNPDDTEELIFLVRHHLLMSHLSQRRDTEDEKILREFALQVQTPQRLQRLYLLTFADMKAVGPEVWNRWKGSLLNELYLRTLDILDREEGMEEARDGRVARIQGRVSRQLAQSSGKNIMKLLPDAYFLTTPEEDIPGHLSLMSRFPAQMYICSVRHYPEKEYSEFAICTFDRPGLFSQIAGVFASLSLDILGARITTRKDGIAFDVFRISHQGRGESILESAVWDRVRKALDRVFSGEADVEELVKTTRQPSFLKKPTVRWVPTEVLIDNAASEKFTVVDVYTRDRVGVLYTITRTLHRLGLTIHLAKISVNVNQIADVFYVTDLLGEKILSPERLGRIKKNLMDALAERSPASVAQLTTQEAEAHP